MCFLGFLAVYWPVRQFTGRRSRSRKGTAFGMQFPTVCGMDTWFALGQFAPPSLSGGESVGECPFWCGTSIATQILVKWFNRTVIMACHAGGVSVANPAITQIMSFCVMSMFHPCSSSQGISEVMANGRMA